MTQDLDGIRTAELPPTKPLDESGIMDPRALRFLDTGLEEPRVPRFLVVAVVAMCCVPLVLSLVGVDLGISVTPGDSAEPVATDLAWHGLRGPLIHTVLSWTAFITAAFVLLLAFFHHRLLSRRSTLVIGVALALAGLLDVLHIVAADRLIPVATTDGQLLSFTWLASRTAKGFILVVGVGAVLWQSHRQYPWGRPKSPSIEERVSRWPVVATALVGLVACAVVYLLLSAVEAPDTAFADRFVSRPYELIPLVVFLFLGVFLYPRLYRDEPSHFTAILVLSAWPDVVAQLYMLTGTAVGFDHHFNAAHLLQILAYWLPCLGLILDYVRLHREREFALWAREQANQALRASEARIRAIVDTAVDAVITIDERGVVHTFNPAAEKIFGYRADEVVGHNVSMLMPEPFRSDHDSYLVRYLNTGKARIIGNGREVVGRRKSGKTFPMELRIGEMKLGDQRRFVGMSRDITERKQMERLKDEFISTVSHELRTPLTSIRGSLGLLVSGSLGNDSTEHKQLLSIALNNTERLVRLINDMLDVEKMRSGKMHFNIRALELMPILEQAVVANRGYADTYGVTIEERGLIPGVWVMADRDRLMQVLTNLLSNAIKYSPPDEPVVLSMNLQDDEVRIAVADKGPGIPEEFHDHIFERFTQADNLDSQRKEGTGLGLHLCRSIVHKLGGRIGFETEIDVGTTFYFVLRERRILARPRKRAPTASESRPCILICDDDRQRARVFTHILGDDGLDAHIANARDQVKSLLADNLYDAITVDLGMSGPDSVAMIRQLRADEHTRSLPVLLTSIELGDGGVQLCGDALDLLDWLDLPLDMERMEAAFERLGQRVSGHPNILHVESDEAALDAVEEAFGKRADLVRACTLADARRKLARGRYDLLVVQLDLPDGCGEDLLSQLDVDEQPLVPAIIVSASARDDDCGRRVTAALSRSESSNAHILEKIRLALG